MLNKRTLILAAAALALAACGQKPAATDTLVVAATPVGPELDLDVDLTIGEATDLGLAQLHAQRLRDLARQCRIGIAGEEHGVEQHGAGPLRCDARRERLGRGGRTRTLECRNQNPMP